MEIKSWSNFEMCLKTGYSPSNVFCNSKTWVISLAFSSSSSGLMSELESESSTVIKARSSKFSYPRIAKQINANDYEMDCHCHSWTSKESNRHCCYYEIHPTRQTIRYHHAQQLMKILIYISTRISKSVT